MSTRKQKDYKNGKIYQVTSHMGDKIYIGSTTKQYLSQRMDLHRSQYKQWKLGKAGKVMLFDMFNEYGVENCQILLLELCVCSCNDAFSAREGYYIRTMSCVNKVVPGRTRKEYYEDNEEELLVHAMQYYNDNKEHRLEQMKHYNDEHREHISDYKKQYREDNKEKLSEQGKQYREDNKEKILEKHKQYYKDNKQEILDKHKLYEQTKIQCACGSNICQGSKNKHERSLKHQTYLKAQQL